jgi:antitoxin CptB
LSPQEFGRLKWSCRRGLLENDLVLEKFLERHGEALEGEQLEAFKSLLLLDDNSLWEILSGRREPEVEAGPAAAEVLSLLRAC